MLLSDDSGRGVTVAYTLWERAVRVQIPAPRQKMKSKQKFTVLILVFVCLIAGAVSFYSKDKGSSDRELITDLDTPIEEVDTKETILPISNSQILYVAPEKEDCVWSERHRCYKVKESDDQAWAVFHYDIKYFIFEPGYDYKLLVDKQESNDLSLNRILEKKPSENTKFSPLKGQLLGSIYDNGIVFVYSTDGKDIYYQGDKIKGTDVSSFSPIENGRYAHFYAKDKNHAYYRDRMIEGSDPSSFAILWTLPPEGCQLSTYSKDKTHLFFNDQIVSGADLESFTPLIIGPVKGSLDKTYGEYAKDKYHVFKG